MSYRVVVADHAALELMTIAQWWSQNRSHEQAERWYNGFVDALNSLASNPERCAFARENGRFSLEIRQLNYSVSKRPTHRAVFTIQGDTVTVLAIRHHAQVDIPPDSLR
jgi:plasmid stabilization system protein ParE